MHADISTRIAISWPWGESPLEINGFFTHREKTMAQILVANEESAKCRMGHSA
jgi:hypothetical protein